MCVERIAWVTGHEDVATILWRDWKHIFFTYPTKKFLLFLPLRAILSLLAFVLSGDELFDGNNGNRVCWSNWIIVAVFSAPSLSSHWWGSRFFTRMFAIPIG